MHAITNSSVSNEILDSIVSYLNERTQQRYSSLSFLLFGKQKKLGWFQLMFTIRSKARYHGDPWPYQSIKNILILSCTCISLFLRQSFARNSKFGSKSMSSFGQNKRHVKNNNVIQCTKEKTNPKWWLWVFRMTLFRTKNLVVITSWRHPLVLYWFDTLKEQTTQVSKNMNKFSKR